jgi:hypothetical protein
MAIRVSGLSRVGMIGTEKAMRATIQTDELSALLGCRWDSGEDPVRAFEGFGCVRGLGTDSLGTKPAGTILLIGLKRLPGGCKL